MSRLISYPFDRRRASTRTISSGALFSIRSVVRVHPELSGSRILHVSSGASRARRSRRSEIAHQNAMMPGTLATNGQNFGMLLNAPKIALLSKIVSVRALRLGMKVPARVFRARRNRFLPPATARREVAA